MRLDHGERNVLRARSQQTEWTCIISLSLVQFASMSCNSAYLHSCAFQDRLWMNAWRECWTDANFSGSARIEDRRVGRGGRQHLMLLRRFTLLFSPTLSTAETLSVLFALSLHLLPHFVGRLILSFVPAVTSSLAAMLPLDAPKKQAVSAKLGPNLML